MDESQVLSYKSLQVIPVVADESYLTRHAPLGHYTTLKEAMAAGTVSVTERVDDSRSNSGGESVSTLYVENTGDDTLFIMAGELVKGGRQDRVIARDFLLDPHSGKTDLSVFCVEHGRWTYNEAASYDLNLVGVQSTESKSLKFSSEGKVVSNKVRKTAMKDKNQSAVWDEVQVVTDKNGAGSSTGTYNALDSSKTYTAQLDDYLGFFTGKFDASQNIVGVVVMSGGRVIGCDIFCKPDLFRREYSGLLNAYLAEVISGGGGEECNVEKAKEFFNKTLKEYSDPSDKSSDQKLIHLGKVVHFSGFDS